MLLRFKPRLQFIQNRHGVGLPRSSERIARHVLLAKCFFQRIQAADHRQRLVRATRIGRARFPPVAAAVRQASHFGDAAT
jgi:hypothetical protein